MILLLSFIFCCVGCSFLFQTNSLNRRRLSLVGLSNTRRLTLIFAAFFCFIGSIVLLIYDQGIAFSTLIFPLLFFIISLVMSIVLSYKPDLIKSYIQLFEANAKAE